VNCPCCFDKLAALFPGETSTWLHEVYRATGDHTLILSSSYKAAMASFMRARGNKLFFHGNRDKPMQQGDRLASGHAGALGSRCSRVFRAGRISGLNVLAATCAADQCRAESSNG